MRFWWLIASLLALVGAGVLLAWPAQPAWRILVDGNTGCLPHFVSTDGERLYARFDRDYLDKEHRKYEIATRTGEVMRFWREPGQILDNVVYLDDAGYLPIQLQLPKSDRSPQRLLVLEMTTGKTLYQVELGTEKMRFVGKLCRRHLVAVNLDPVEIDNHSTYLQKRIAVLIDLQNKTHRIVPAHLILGIADFDRVLVSSPEHTWGVLDLSTQHPLTVIPGENMIAVVPHQDRFRLVTTKVEGALTFRLTRYEWKPGQAPKQLAASESFQAHEFNLVAFTAQDGDTLRRDVNGKYALPFIKDILNWLNIEDNFETWEQRDFTTGEVKRSWNMRTIPPSAHVIFHPASKRAYFTDKEGYLTAWDLPPQRLTAWAYACLALSLILLALFVFHRRLFRKPAGDRTVAAV